VSATPPPAKPGTPTWVFWVIGCGVLAVIGLFVIPVIFAIAIPSAVHARAQAQTAEDEANLKQLGVAVEAYNSANGHYPKSISELAPQYIKVVPTVPGSGGKYVYYRPAKDTRVGAFEIADDGSRDPTTTRSLIEGPGGATCLDCSYIAYGESIGLFGEIYISDK
jgi:hypothetical protein